MVAPSTLFVKNSTDNFITTAKNAYKEKFGKEPVVIDVVIGDGSRKLC